MLRKFIVFATAIACSAAIVSCKKSESDDLAAAQKCLDEVPQDNPEAADGCLHYVEKYDSQQASILKCSIYMTSGGLVENKVVKAYTALKDTAQTNKEAAFMAVLALDRPNVNAGYDKAIAADRFCQASGVSGLKYISGVIVAGTYMNKVIGGVNVDDPAAIASAVQIMLDKCAPTPPTAIDPSCTTDIATLGTTVVTLADSYCDGDNANEGVCTQVNAAVAASGGNTSDVGLALFCYLNKKTFNSTTHECQ
jgi:hypothetical protein